MYSPLCFITNRMRGIWNTKGAPQDNLLFCHSCDCDHTHFPSTLTSTETSKVLVKIRLINFLEGSQTTRVYWLTLPLFNGNLPVGSITWYHANTDKGRMWNIFWVISERFDLFDSKASFDFKLTKKTEYWIVKYWLSHYVILMLFIYYMFHGIRILVKEGGKTHHLSAGHESIKTLYLTIGSRDL